MANGVTEKVPQIDYTSKDFDSIINDLVNRIQFFNPEWTDFNESDFGITMLELFAFTADGLHYNLDRQANECFLPTAVKRESVVKLLKLIDYELPSAQPASVDLTFTLDSTELSPVTILAGTECQTEGDEDPVFFETTEDLIIPAGQLSGIVGAFEGLSKNEDLPVSDGLSFQQKIIQQVPIIDGTIETFIDEGSGDQEWTEVDSLASSGSTDLHYITQRDADDIVSIFFGDNANGKIPLLNSTIRSEFRLGGGLRGNVGANTVVVINSTILLSGQPIILTVNNVNSASGGVDRQSASEAKILGPRSLQTLDRAVTPNDYKTLAETIPGVAKAIANPEGFMNVDVFIAPNGGGLPSTALKDQVEAFLDARNCTGTLITMRDPTYVDVDILGAVIVKSNFVNKDVETAVLAAITAELAFTNQLRSFGTSVFLSDIFALIDNIEGVSHVNLDKMAPNPFVTLQIWTGDGVFSAVELGLRAVDEIWTIAFTSPTEFAVTGSVSGIQTNTGTINNQYSSDLGEVTFTITSGINPNNIGDVATFRASERIGNIELLASELAQEGTIALTFTGGA